MTEPLEPTRKQIDVSLDDLDRRISKNAKFEEIPKGVLGYIIFKWLLLITGVLLTLLVTYGIATYPQFAHYKSLATSKNNALSLYAAAQAQWSNNIKGFGETFLITPIIPLIGTVLGYIFGRHEQSEK